MSKDDLTYVRHMLDAARKATDFSRGRSRNDLDSDEILALALVRLLEIIGEAARNISQETKTSYPGIAWQQIMATRNRLIHGYFDVDLDIVWSIITTDLPELLMQLEQLIEHLQSEDGAG